jgi:tetratricopeptide (TPR) repeat protein
MGTRTLCLMAAVMLAGVGDAAAQDPIAAGYMRLYSGRPEDAAAHFERLRADDPDALAPWFGTLFVTMARLDHEESLAEPFEQSVDAFIEHAEARRAQSETDSAALFYLAQSYLLRSIYRLSTDQGMWGVTRDAARAKRYAEEYIKRHPEHGDAYLGLGLYNYFADIAPNFVKVLRVLLFLPAGSRTEGLRQLERASREGSLFAPFAQLVLADIYSSFESRVRDGLAIGVRFVARFPENAEARLELAGMYMHPVVEDFARSEEHYKIVLAASTGNTLRHIAQRHSAIVGLASLRRSQWRIREAIDLLTGAIESAPAKPAWILPTLLIRRANYRMLTNDPSAAEDARRVLADASMKRWHEPAREQIEDAEERRGTNEGVVYAALLAANRLVAEDRFDAARAAYEAVARTYPGDWQVRYRLAYLDFARRRYDAAAAGMQAIAASNAKMPDWLKAAAILHLAYTHDLAGRREQAVQLYKRVVDDYEDEASATAARFGLVAPYRGDRERAAEQAIAAFEFGD